MLKRVTLPAALLLLAPCLSAQTAAGSAKTVSSLISTSSSSSNDYEATNTTSLPRPAAGPTDDPTASPELWARSYCAGHPGEDWTRATQTATQSGHCPAADDKSVAVLNNFLAHHKKIAPSPVNTETLAAYVSSNNLNPREAKSYERAYKSLRNTGELELYK